MALFKKPASGSIGVDYGSSGIKIVQLSAWAGKSRLVTYGYYQQQQNETSNDLMADPKKSGLLLKQVCAKAKVSAVRASASLPTSDVFTTVISVPFSKDKKILQETIRNRAAKLLPQPMEEMMMDSQVIEEEMKGPTVQKKGRETVRVLITASDKKKVKKYIDIFKAAGLELKGLEPESTALIRSLVGKDKSPIMILDIGAHITNLSIVELGIPFINRSIKLGGGAITKKIAEQFGVSIDEAEAMKQDLQSETGEVPKLVKEMADPIIDDIKYSIESFASQEHTRTKTVEKIILTGGSSHLPMLSAYLEQRLDINVFVGDPWARISFPNGMRPILDEIGARMAISVGLAMRELVE